MLAAALLSLFVLPASGDDGEVRALLHAIELSGEGEPATGLRAWVDALVGGTPLSVAIEPRLEDALSQEYFVLPSVTRTLPDHLRAGAGPGPDVVLRVAGGRVLLLSLEGAQELAEREARYDEHRVALDQRLNLHAAQAEPLARFAARVAAVWGRPVEVDARLAGSVTLPAGTFAVRVWLERAATQAGGTLALRPEGALLTLPDRAARLARGPVQDVLVASQLRERTLATPTEDREWSLTELIDRLERELDLNWPHGLRVANTYWRFGGRSVEWSHERWLSILTRRAGPPEGSNVPVIPLWMIRDGQVEIYDGSDVTGRFFEAEHDD